MLVCFVDKISEVVWDPDSGYLTCCIKSCKFESESRGKYKRFAGEESDCSMSCGFVEGVHV